MIIDTVSNKARDKGIYGNTYIKVYWTELNYCLFHLNFSGRQNSGKRVCLATSLPEHKCKATGLRLVENVPEYSQIPETPDVTVVVCIKRG